ncbi:MAG: polysaccharide deacetylase family protein [Lachnospira sp.]|nr:polysaccharide deacetylase family protein [Lachnospira sp.]
MNKVYKAFPGGKHKVLTLSYDDGKEEDRRLVKILNKYGIKATFNLNSDLADTKGRIPMSEWKELYAGHEVAAHTCNHPTIARCPGSEIAGQILNDRIELEKVMGYPVRGLAFPNGSYDDRCCNIASDLGIEYARLVGDKYAAVHAAKKYAKYAEGPILVGDENGFDMPSDYMRWLFTCHHNHNLIQFGKDFMSLKKCQYLYMMSVWGHSFEFEKDNTWYLIEEFCEMISGQDDIWYATNIEIVDNEKVFSNLKFAADNSFVYNPSAASAWLVVNDNNIVEVKGGETVQL